MTVKRGNIYFLLIITIITFLGAGSRFWRLGYWSISGDELATEVETESLLAKNYFISNNRYDALPRAIPVGYAWNALFITDNLDEETAYRLGSAISGILIIPIIFLMASKLKGRTFGFLLSSLILFSRWNILFAQSARFYSFAFFLCSISLLSFCLAIKEADWKWGLLAGTAAGLAALTHTISGLVFILELAGLLTLSLLMKVKLKNNWIPAFAIPSSLLIILAVVLYMHFCGIGFNKGTPWGYTPLHLLLGIASDLGWSIACFSALGFLVILSNYKKYKIESIFATFGFLLVILGIVASKLVVFRQDYLFPISLSFYALAAIALQEIGETLKSNGKNKIAIVFYAVILALQLPALISYYQDGQRYDWRKAAQTIDSCAKPSEIVYSTEFGNLRHYIKKKKDNILPLVRLSEVRKNEKLSDQTVWVVVNYGRNEIPSKLRLWLDKNGNRMAHIYKMRFDYYQFVIDIYKMNVADLTDLREQGQLLGGI